MPIATTIQENESVISSTNSLLNFKDGQIMKYSVVAPEDHVILLKFINFEIEDTTDFIKVLGGLCFLR